MMEAIEQRPPHPRRPPAHKSVSLRHSTSPNAPTSAPSRPGTALSKVPSSACANRPSSNQSKSSLASSLKPGSRQESSGESSNAEKWFENSNNRVRTSAPNTGDNEPPFYLRNSSSSETPGDAPENRAAALDAIRMSLPNLAGASLGPTPSGSEDFRSIVDDLTVENKKLKRKLKKYEKMYDAHLQQEKLFEIKVHGLPPSKKRELEDTLRKFALSLGGSPQHDGATESTRSSSTPALRMYPTASSSHASTKFADSAYVSASGQTSVTASRVDPTPKPSKSSSAQRREDIQSYLHDIPLSLMPRQPVAMTEKAKRKLVVRRLEEIFAGKGAAIGGHQQPQQQQEVSQSAAHADRMAVEAAGEVPTAEGTREAHIFRKSSHDGPSATAAPKQITHSRLSDEIDQRPTRPLDLDIHRAQVPQDNIDYIRHLGFSPADFDTKRDAEEGHGWIYLNVLNNMAQLHTLNVTNDFIMQSINDHSKKLALSRDGRKVRWKGGRDVTIASSDGSPRTGLQSPSSKLNGLKKKRSSIAASPNDLSSGSPAQTPATNRNNKLAYVPLFVHRQSSDEDDSSEETPSWESPQQEQVKGDSSGFTSSAMHTVSSKRKRDNDGPIIFYNKARFCTDLSGDRGEPAFGQQSAIRYNTISKNPVGAPPSADFDDVYDRRSIVRQTVQEDFMDLDDVSRSEDMDGLRFSPMTASSGLSEAPMSPSPVDLEASGLGGVHPDDNFQITVQSSYMRTGATALPRASHFQNKASSLAPTGHQVATTQSSEPPVQEHVIATRWKELGPALLPEPASLFKWDSLEADDDSLSTSDVDSNVSSLPDDGDVASTVPQMLHLSSHSSDEDSDDEEEESEDDEEDGSVDFLALARELDPKTVHEREREYNANMAERMAEEIPAGSSAATAGGGSGFNSPAGDGNHGVGRKVSILRSPEGVSSSLRRRATSGDSTAVQGGHEAKYQKVG